MLFDDSQPRSNTVMPDRSESGFGRTAQVSLRLLLRLNPGGGVGAGRRGRALAVQAFLRHSSTKALRSAPFLPLASELQDFTLPC